MIDWFGFLTVALTTLLGAGFVVVTYSLGIRFTAISGDDVGRINQAAKWGSYICFALCILAVLSGIVLIVPFLSEAAADILGNIF
ncbi:hypothetical protein ACFUCV_12825 [Specibacter sp. NPDC057265]|uniref:hypothetical protein n=1 Tax=Specibacter sp. NPDC057265 TaxID=3346075 RepID=UPI00362A6083